MQDLTLRDHIAIQTMKVLLNWDEEINKYFDIAAKEIQYERQIASASYALADAMIHFRDKLSNQPQQEGHFEYTIEENPQWESYFENFTK